MKDTDKNLLSHQSLPSHIATCIRTPELFFKEIYLVWIWGMIDLSLPTWHWKQFIALAVVTFVIMQCLQKTDNGITLTISKD